MRRVLFFGTTRESLRSEAEPKEIGMSRATPQREAEKGVGLCVNLLRVNQTTRQTFTAGQTCDQYRMGEGGRQD